MSGDADRHAPVVAPVVAPGERVRVCIVAPSLDILGGQAVQASRLLGRLRQLPTLEVDFLAVNPRLPGPLRLLQRIKYVRTIATSIAYVAQLLRRLPRYDVVHAFSASYFSFLLAPVPAMAIARLYGKFVILNYRSGEAADHLARWRRTTRPTMRLADAIVVPSGYLVGVFGSFGIGARAIANFVETDRIPYRPRRVPAPIFLSNRNLVPMYNLPAILRAFARIQARVPEARLIVAGHGSQEAELRALAESLGLRHVRFTGRVAPEAMPALYDEADIYLNAPDIDNMPNSILEAWVAGLPVVTTNAGGIPHIVTHGRTGLMVERGDAEGLAREALRLLEEPGLAEALANAAREECLTRYTWSAVGGEWERLYRDGKTRRAASAGPARPAVAER